MTTTPKSEILTLVDLADYQDGAIVSRQITKAEGGNITLFTFDLGQELSEHSAPYDALVHVLDGEAEIKIAGKAYLVKEGEAIIMPADIPHAVKAVKKFKMLLSMVKA
jgi:quercetin dioxygenase-like cupin family protein